MSKVVYVLFEQQLSSHNNKPKIVWQNISIYKDRSDAYEYAATVEDQFKVYVMEKNVISDDVDNQGDKE